MFNINFKIRTSKEIPFQWLLYSNSLVELQSLPINKYLGRLTVTKDIYLRNLWKKVHS